MRIPNVVVLTIDRLGAPWLGPYGNTWLDTPNFNRLAASSVLCEWVMPDSPDISSIFRSYLTGQHTCGHRDGAALLPRMAAEAGNPARLLTDDAEIAALGESFGFETNELKVVGRTKSAKTIEESSAFAFFAEAVATLEQSSRPGFLWLHTRGLGGAWDAPPEFRNQFADEDDPEPPTFVEPPNVILPEGFDPDELLGFVQAYAGQVALFDTCLGMLLDWFDEREQDSMLVVTSPRGYPLGEHRRVGPCDGALYGELLNVPLFVRFPKRQHALARLQSLLQPHDLFPLVCSTLGVASEQTPCRIEQELLAGSVNLEQMAIAVAPTERSIRTPAWFLRESRQDDQPRYELFAKPDDRCEANEVASRGGDIVELLAAELDRFCQLQVAATAQTAPLDSRLYDKWR